MRLLPLHRPFVFGYLGEMVESLESEPTCSKEFVVESIANQSVVLGPVATASLVSLLGTETLRLTPDQLNQNLPFCKIPSDS